MTTLIPSSIEASTNLRASAMAADERATADVDLPALWRDLAQGAYCIIDYFFSDDRCYLVLSPTDQNGAPQALAGRRLEILEAVLRGLLQKNVAIDLALAPSTVALNSRLALESLGVHCKPSRAHPLLMLAAAAGYQAPLTPARSARFIDANGRALRVIAAPRPDRHLAKLLPSAELAVIRRLIEGQSYAEIARERGTSTRTIANQITAVFRRLGVSGRNELVQRLLFDATVGRPTPKAIPETLVPSVVTQTQPRTSWREALRSA